MFHFIFIALKAQSRGVLVMMVEHPQQQPRSSTLPLQTEHQQVQQIIEQHQFIIPTTTTITNGIDTTKITLQNQEVYDEEVNDENGSIIINVKNDTTTIKQVGTINLFLTPITCLNESTLSK